MDVKRIALLAAALGLACGRKDGSAPDSASGSASPSTAMSAAPGTPKAACPKDGHWNGCLVLERLEHSGLAPQKNAKIDELPKLAGTPAIYMLNTSPIAVYLYADTMSRRRAAASLDSARFIPQSRALSMKNETTLIENDNLLALLYSRNEHQRERVSDALTAGPPQP